ncbi:MAG: hypothetical protein QOI42_181, partial [Frankiaceae bacterium]|nr:hypothetical protein [Frankiaceae bacterium]
SVTQTYVAGNVTDADASTYWESAGNAFPQWVQVDLGASQPIGKLVLKLPPATSWAARTETLSVQASNDGTTFATIVGSAAYTFDPATGNTVTIPVSGSPSGRFVRVLITANTGWPAGQLSDLQVYAPSGGGSGTATLTASPTSLTFPSTTVGTSSATQTVTVSNTGTAAAAVSSVAVTGDFAQTNTCGSSVAAGGSCSVTVTFRPTVAGTRTGTLTVASNATNPSLTVSLSGTGVSATTNLAAGKPTSESSQNQTYASSAVTDGNQSTYWESANNALPQWVQVDLGSSLTVGRLVLKLPASWGSRSQTLAVTGSTDGAAFASLKSSASYTFDPASGNTVTVTFPAVASRYLRITVTANSGWPAGQLSEFEVYSS